MTASAQRYRRLAQEFADRVRAVPEARWSDPTPCEEWDARDLLRHVIDTQGRFLGLVGRDLGDLPDVDVDATAAWDAARAVVQHDLDDPDLARTEFDSRLGRFTFEDAVDRFVCSDLIVHTWDLARATGQDERLDPDDATRALEAARGYGDTLRAPGFAGPEIPVPADADASTRLLGFYGRMP